MKTIEASAFAADCLQLIDEVAETGETLVITKEGRPVLQLDRVAPRPKSLIGLHRGQIRILGDIIEPLDDLEWKALR